MMTKRFASILLIACLFPGCAVMSPSVEPAPDLQDLPFEELVREAGQYVGETVVVGGYVLSVENKARETILTAVQAPLGVGQKPKSKDLSQGRLILVRDGFLDPEVFEKDRQITVGGTILGSSASEKEAVSYPYLRLQVEEIHLWPKETMRSAYPYYYWDDPWWGRPYPWYWRYPYHWR